MFAERRTNCMITLYHGSNIEINQIDLSLSRKGKDFGCGFYLNANKQQAIEMAVRTANRMKAGSPVVSAFEFDLRKCGLCFLISAKRNRNWCCEIIG